MIPYDGFGYGVSQAFEYSARHIAIENGEACNHWEYPANGIHDIQIKISPFNDIDYKIEITCNPRLKGICDRKFPLTEKALKQRFKDLNQ